MTEVLALAARTAFTYGALLLLARICSKQFVSETSTFDFILILILGDLVDNIILGEVTFAQFFAAAGSLAFMELLLAGLSFKFATLKKLLDGTAVVLLANNKPVRAALRKELLSLTELEALLRLKGIERSRWKEIKSAQLETTGEVSALKLDEFRAVKKSEKHLLE